MNVGGVNLGAAGASLGGNLKGQVIDFAVTKALDGAFYYVGQEESAIRKDPMSWVSSDATGVTGRTVHAASSGSEPCIAS